MFILNEFEAHRGTEQAVLYGTAASTAGRNDEIV